jgi:hypothetical protein
MLGKTHGQGQVMDSVQSMYPDNDKAQANVIQLACLVRDATIANKEKGLGPNTLMNVSCVIRKQFKDLVVIRAKELGMSQDAYFRLLIVKDLKSRYNLSADPVVETRIIKDIKKGKLKII